jgi:hypothetical protein
MQKIQWILALACILSHQGGLFPQSHFSKARVKRVGVLVGAGEKRPEQATLVQCCFPSPDRYAVLQMIVWCSLTIRDSGPAQASNWRINHGTSIRPTE